MLKHIEIEQDTNLENKYVKSFVKIGQIWESWTETIGGKITGFLNFYGVKLDSSFVLDSNQIDVNILKQYNNTGPGSATYSNITKIVIQLENGYYNNDFKVVRTNWLRRTTWFLSNFSNIEAHDGYIYRADSYELIKQLQESNVHKIPNFGWMKCTNGITTLKFYSIPDTVAEVSNYIRVLNKILQTTANKG